MVFIVLWYVLGLTGTCLMSYVDAKESTNGQDEHLANYLILSIFGPINFCVGIYAIYYYIKEKGNIDD
tara:strand:- start:19 stop:222 length:204 start_codon:yes stop_codon:yes gene_type:complete